MTDVVEKPDYSKLPFTFIVNNDLPDDVMFFVTPREVVAWFEGQWLRLDRATNEVTPI